ncbi:hypothetical protein ACSNN7_08630 [Micromonospora sp. URMC 105]|uniref:hypothetical protein n=1 Tax=Micromonospora sp. URMC 105 TaxID=3423413 RepID=UPI003F1DEEF9
MRAATAWPSGWWARLLLLACTLLGLAAMHTIGHGTHSTASHSDGHAVGSSPTATRPEPAAPAAPADGVPAAHAAVAPVSGAAHAAVAPVSGAGHVTVAPVQGAGSAAVTLVPGPEHVADLAAGQDCAGADCRRTAAEASAGGTLALPADPPSGAPSGWSVCLAVLGAVTVTLLLAALLLRRARAAGATRRPRRPSRGPRAPPPDPVGLRLATVSVLRR